MIIPRFHVNFWINCNLWKIVYHQRMHEFSAIRINLFWSIEWIWLYVSIRVLFSPYVTTTHMQLCIHLFLCRGAIGDLYLFIHVKERQGICREGLNLHSEVSIDYTEAILGTTIKVNFSACLYFSSWFDHLLGGTRWYQTVLQHVFFKSVWMTHCSQIQTEKNHKTDSIAYLCGQCYCIICKIDSCQDHFLNIIFQGQLVFLKVNTLFYEKMETKVERW